MRPNEKFSGGGHARHLCKECSRLGKEELKYRQAVRDIDRTATWEGLILRKQRRRLESFLGHPNQRVRQYAEKLFAHDAAKREQRRQGRLEWAGDEETYAEDAWLQERDNPEQECRDGTEEPGGDHEDRDEWDDSEIPF